jgi:hypothetical protein
MARANTATQEELENELGVRTSYPYSLRADQLVDGTYRYALEDERTGEILAEGIDSSAEEAMRRFEADLEQTDLTPAERNAFREAMNNQSAGL